MTINNQPPTTGGDYLWDRSGEPDAAVASLEALLRPASFRPRALDLPLAAAPAASSAGSIASTKRRRGSLRRGPLLAAAATLLLAVSAALVGRAGTPPAWEVETLEGRPRIANAAVSGPAALAVGQWLQTDAASRARIEVGTIGDVTVEPGTRVRITESTSRRKALELARGRIEAFITAPPRLFLVDTPAARAVDLGCAYTLEVDDEGAGVLRVTLGYVALEGAGLVSTVPRGASCTMRPGHGPGTPFFADADPALLGALRRLDDGGSSKDDLDAVLGRARPRDALTLWHLLARTTGDQRSAVYDRLASLIPPPPGLERAAALRLESAALELWWHAMPF